MARRTPRRMPVPKLSAPRLPIPSDKAAGSVDAFESLTVEGVWSDSSHMPWDLSTSKEPRAVEEVHEKGEQKLEPKVKGKEVGIRSAGIRKAMVPYGSLVDDAAKNLINEAQRAMPSSSFVASVTMFFVERGFISASQAEALRKSIGDANAYRQDVQRRKETIENLEFEIGDLEGQKELLTKENTKHLAQYKKVREEIQTLDVKKKEANDALHALLIDTKLVKEARIEADAEGADISRMHCPFCGRLILFVINKSPKKRSKAKVVSTKKAQARPYTGKCECGAPYRLDSDYLIRFDYRQRYLEDESRTADIEVRTRKLELD